MIIDRKDAEKRIVMIKPNHSATWRANLLLIAAVSVPSLGAGVGFALLGAWPILPFAGAELVALTTALYYVNWKLEYRHVVTLTSESVAIEKGYFAPKSRWIWVRSETSLSVSAPTSDWDIPKLMLHNRSLKISVGDFLNREETLDLQKLLKGELRTQTDSHISSMTL